MKTAVQIFLRQTVRGKKRLVLNAALLLAVTGFFVVGLNLYHNSRQNLLTVENAYTTIATMEIYGDVDAQGNLVHPAILPAWDAICCRWRGTISLRCWHWRR